MRYLDTYTDAEGRIVADPRQAVRVDRDIFDDDGHLVRREWWVAEPMLPLPRRIDRV